MTGVPYVVFCIGKERWLREQAIVRLKSETVAAGFEEADTTAFSADPLPQPPLILEALRTAPLGPGRRLVVIRGLEELSEKTLPWLAAYLKQPNPQSLLVLCADKSGQERLFLSLTRGRPAVLRIIPCGGLKGPALAAWISEQAGLFGKSIEPEATQLLIDRRGADLQALRLAVESLTLLVAQAGRITAADVRALTRAGLQETAFGILDAAGAGRPAVALQALRQALQAGQLSLEKLVGALGWYYRMIWKARRGAAANSWGSADRRAALARLRRWPQRRIAKALEEVLQADWDLKTGAPLPELVVDQLLLKLGS